MDNYDVQREQAEGSREWIQINLRESLEDGKATEVMIKERVIAVFRHEGGLFAMDGMCAHQGGPISEGQVEHGCVTCPWHGWQYELDTGIQTINRQPLQETFQIRESDGKLEILI
ncbi:MAG: ferredoxin [Rhodopirellula sp.]|nr:ferredoxin [Rhodopirellula sp.]